MSRRPYRAPLSLTDDERATLKDRLCAKDLPRHRFMRLAIILMLADGATPEQIAEIFCRHPSMIRRYRKLFERQGSNSIFRPRLSPKRKYGPEINQKILDMIARPPPDKRRCWTAKLIAERLDSVHYQYIWQFIRNRRIDLCTGQRRRRR